MAFNLGLILEILKDIAAIDPIIQELLSGLGGTTVLAPNTIKALSALRERSSRLAEKAKKAPISENVGPKDNYVMPPLGTELSPAYNTLPYPSNADDQNYVNRYKQAAAQQTALDMTKAVKGEYLNVTFPDWLISYDAGRANDVPPPKPPKGFMAVVIMGEGGDLEFDLQQVDHWVCAVPEYAKIPMPKG